MPSAPDTPPGHDPLSGLAPEMRVLLAACSVGERAFPPFPPVDARRLVALAVFHRVAALVSAAGAWLPLPPEAAAPLRAAAMATLHRNLQFAAELKLALRALNAEGVPVVILKGAHLMDAVYASPALRPLSDLDILVQPEHAARALDALAGAGYAANARKAAFTLRADQEVRLEKSGVHDVVIELHTSLNRRTRHHWFPMRAVWDRAEPYPFEGAPALALHPADNLTFLCAHAAPHAFAQLSWLRDIAGVAGLTRDWAAVMDVARASRTRRATFAGLHLAETLLGATVDGSALRALGGASAGRLAAWLSPARLLADTRYSTLQSLRMRAALADSRANGAAMVAAALARKTAETLRGHGTQKARTGVLS